MKSTQVRPKCTAALRQRETNTAVTFAILHENEPLLVFFLCILHRHPTNEEPRHGSSSSNRTILARLTVKQARPSEASLAQRSQNETVTTGERDGVRKKKKSKKERSGGSTFFPPFGRPQHSSIPGMAEFPAIRGRIYLLVFRFLVAPLPKKGRAAHIMVGAGGRHSYRPSYGESPLP